MTVEQLKDAKFVRLDKNIIEIQKIGDVTIDPFIVYYIEESGPDEGSGWYMRSCYNTEIDEIIKEAEYPEYFL